VKELVATFTPAFDPIEECIDQWVIGSSFGHRLMSSTPFTIETVEMHTGGEPVRIVVAGYPPIPGATLLAKRRQARERLDEFRRLLMFEPRGHVDMYGVIPVAPGPPREGEPAADLAVLFMHNEGYSTMCGPAVIALGRWAAVTIAKASAGGYPVGARMGLAEGIAF